VRSTLHQEEMGGDSINISVHKRGGCPDLAAHLLRGVFFPILVQNHQFRGPHPCVYTSSVEASSPFRVHVFLYNNNNNNNNIAFTCFLVTAHINLARGKVEDET